MEWFRWYSGTVSDPKWQLVAADSGQPVAFVLAVWAHVLERANAGNGTMDGWNSRVVAVSIGATSEEVNAIIDAMQGLVLDGDAVSKWSERQPKRREDDSAERVRAHRAKKRNSNAVTDAVTQCNAPQRTETLEESRVEEIRDNVIHQHCDSHLTAPQKIAGATQEGHDDDGRSKRGSRLKADWCPSGDDLAFASSLGLDASGEADKFRDYWLAQPGQKGVKLDWTATWRNWCRRSAERPPSGKKPQGGGGGASSVMEALRWNLNQPQREIDVFGRRIRNGLDDGEGCCPGPAGKSPRP